MEEMDFRVLGEDLLGRDITFHRLLGKSGGVDTSRPTVVITSTESSPTAANPIPITITFSKNVTGFAVGDLSVTNGAAGNFAGSGAVYTADITPNGAGAVAVDIAAGVCADGSGNLNLAATQFAIGIIVTLTLQPAAAAGIDCYVREDTPDGATPNTTNISCVATGGLRRFGLLKFDLSSIPAGATINSATLYLYNQSTATGNRTVTLNGILAANSGWVEAATWNYADGAGASDRWAGDAANDGGIDAGCSVSGTDFNATALGTISYIANTPTETEHSCALNVAQVQAWLSANYGMRLSINTGTLAFHSSDAVTAGLRPKLVIVYSLEPG